MIAVVLLFGLAQVSQAAGLVPCGGEGQARCELNDIFSLVVNSYTFAVFNLATPLAILVIVIGGVYMVLAGVSPSYFDKGKQMVIWAVIAWGLIFCAYLIINTVLDALGYNLPRSF